MLASYKSIIGIILFNLSTTISLKKIFCHIFLALELHLLFLIDFDCQTLHTVLTPGISLIKQDIEVYVNENVLDNLSRQWQKFDQLRHYKPRKSLFAETPTMVIVLEMGSRQITHIPVLICRDSYKGNSTRTGVLANNTYHKPLGSDCLDSWHLCLPVGQLGFPNIHGYTWIFKQKYLQILQILLHISYKKLNWLHITGTYYRIVIHKIKWINRIDLDTIK